MQTAVTFTKSIASGILITIGCAVFLSSGDRITGAALFTVALCSICTLGIPLFTGAVGFARTLKELGNLGIVLIGNTVGCAVSGLIISIALPEVYISAAALIERKDYLAHIAFILSFVCGILMYVAVYTYRSKNSYLGVFLCVPTFIIAGFEHSIAYMGYLGLARAMSLQILMNLIIFIIGNGIGAFVFGLIIQMTGKRSAEGV